MEVNHKDGEKDNNRPENLEHCTRKENVRHAEAMGLMLHARGSRQHLAKLHESDIPRIRFLGSEGISHAAIGAAYGVSKTAIGDVLRNRTWRHVLGADANSAAETLKKEGA
jgi:hypothetical protein